MKKFLDPGYWQAVGRNPVAMVGLAADLAPVAGIIFWHWGAAALVLLYWLENVVIGGFAVLRVIYRNVARNGPLGVIGSFFNIPFFVIYYGGFCFVHGALLLSLFQSRDSWPLQPDLAASVGWLLSAVLSFAPLMDWMLVLLVAAHGSAFLHDYVLKGGWRETTADREMIAPYGRVIVLHLGMFIVGGALFVLGDPAIGALLLVIARAPWGLQVNMKPAASPGPPSRAVTA